MPSLLVPSRTTVYPQSGRLDRFRTSPLRRDAMLWTGPITRKRPGRDLLAEPLTSLSAVGNTGIEPVTSSASTLPAVQPGHFDQAIPGQTSTSPALLAVRIVVNSVISRRATRSRRRWARAWARSPSSTHSTSRTTPGFS